MRWAEQQDWDYRHRNPDTNQDSASHESATNSNNNANSNTNEATKQTFPIRTHHHNMHNTATVTTAARNNAILYTNNNLTLMGVDMTKLQFATWVHYYLLHMTEDGEVMLPNHHHGQSELEQRLEMLHQISHEITTPKKQIGRMSGNITYPLSITTGRKGG